MKEKEFGVITFNSTQYAIKADTVFSKESVNFRTIPTPREISRSCGLAIKFNIEDMEKIKDIINKSSLEINGIYKIVRDEGINKVEKISQERA